MRILAVIVSLVGVAVLVLGVLFIVQAGSAEQEVADSIQPLQLAEVDATYEAVKTKHMAMRAAEEPDIQAGKAAPSATYNYLSIQRTSLGLARTNIGLAALVRTTGILDVALGFGVLLSGLVLFNKCRSAA
ncbi:hypothetical protein ACFLW1_03495 [Chloroflexota bacterium]